MIIPFSRKFNTQGGLSLAELLVALGISSIVLVAVSAFQVNIFRYQRSISGSFNTAQNAQAVVKTMAKEVRMASPAADGSYALLTVATSTLTFHADLAGDGVKQRVRYYLSKGILYKGVTPPSGTPSSYNPVNEVSSIILRDVANPNTTSVFEYFDGVYDGTGTALVQPVTPTVVRLVKFNLVLATPPSQAGQASTTRTYSTQVTLRNLRDNF